MKVWMKSTMAALILAALAAPQFAHADDDEAALAKEETALESAKEQPNWKEALQTRYKLTDEQIKLMEDKGMKLPQMAMTSALAEKSGKPLDEVIKMRTEEKMGWGKIAKQLGVHPGELGKSVSSLRHDIVKEKAEDYKEKKEARKEERKAEREARKEERKAEKEARKAERKAERDARKAERHAKKAERENKTKQ